MSDDGSSQPPPQKTARKSSPGADSPGKSHGGAPLGGGAKADDESKPGWRKAGEGAAAMPVRTFAQSMEFIKRIQGCAFRIKKGFVPNMSVEGRFYVNEQLEGLMLGELQHFCDAKGVGGFLPAVTQIANVSSLPGIVGASMAMPDVHSGYGFAIGNVRVV